MLSFFCTCGLDSSLEVSDKLLYFSYKYNLTFSCFCKYLLFKIENMEMFIFWVLWWKNGNIYCVIKMCSQINVSVSSKKSLAFFLPKIIKTSCAYLGIADDMPTFYCEIIGRVSSEITPMIEYLKNLHYAMVRIWEYHFIFVKCWPYLLPGNTTNWFWDSQWF